MDRAETGGRATEDGDTGAIVDQIERLARLHKEGVLTDGEFAAQKARVLGGLETSTGSAQGGRALSPSWEKRFAFFDANGSPLSKQATLASRDLSFGERAAIFFNIWGMLLGIVYFFYLGIPRRGITMLIVAVGLAMGLWGAENFLDYSPRWYWVAVWAIYGGTANYYYYIKVRYGRDEWNPLKDLL